VGYVQAEGLHHRFGARRNFGQVRTKEQARFYELQDLGSHLRVAGVLVQKRFQVCSTPNFLPILDQGNQLPGGGIQNMHRPGVAVHREMQASLAVNMYAGFI